MYCPRCRSTKLRPSHRRSWLERFRSKVTNKRPFRCRDCRWRGWISVLSLYEGPGEPDPEEPRLNVSRKKPLRDEDLDQLEPADHKDGAVEPDD